MIRRSFLQYGVGLPALALGLSPTISLAQGAAQPAVQPALRQRVLKVAVASVMVDVVRSMAKVVEKQRPGLDIQIEWGASDALYSRIANFTPFDVVFMADDVSMSRLVASRKVSRARVRDFASNSLAVVSNLKITSIEELAEPRFKLVAIGDPAQSAAGRFAREALVFANVWPNLEPKLVKAAHVRHALDHAVRGAVDAAIVYRSDTIVKGVKGLNVLPISASITHYIAPIVGSANPDDAAAFIEFATSESARVALKQLQLQ